jgi:hypothetical protein
VAPRCACRLAWGGAADVGRGVRTRHLSRSIRPPSASGRRMRSPARRRVDPRSRRRSRPGREAFVFTGTEGACRSYQSRPGASLLARGNRRFTRCRRGDRERETTLGQPLPRARHPQCSSVPSRLRHDLARSDVIQAKREGSRRACCGWPRSPATHQSLGCTELDVPASAEPVAPPRGPETGLSGRVLRTGMRDLSKSLESRGAVECQSSPRTPSATCRPPSATSREARRETSRGPRTHPSTRGTPGIPGLANSITGLDLSKQGEGYGGTHRPFRASHVFDLTP